MDKELLINEWIIPILKKVVYVLFVFSIVNLILYLDGREMVTIDRLEDGNQRFLFNHVPHCKDRVHWNCWIKNTELKSMEGTGCGYYAIPFESGQWLLLFHKCDAV